jgi:hypothetical protein
MQGLLQANGHMVQHPIRHTLDYIKKDGNCMFLAVSHWKHGDQNQHEKVREDLHQYAKCHKDVIEGELRGDKFGKTAD